MADKYVTEEHRDTVDSVALWHLRVGRAGLRHLAGGFEVANLTDAADMALVTAEGRSEEGVDQQHRFVKGMLACSDGRNIRVVVFPGQHRSVAVPNQCRPGSGNLIGSHLFAISGAAKDNSPGVATGVEVRHDRLSGTNTKAWVIVLGVVFGRSVIDHVVAQISEMVG